MYSILLGKGLLILKCMFKSLSQDYAQRERESLTEGCKLKVKTCVCLKIMASKIISDNFSFIRYTLFDCGLQIRK